MHFHRTDEVYRYIADHIERTGQSPTIREITAACNLSSVSIASYHLNKLQREGRITRTKDKPRSIVLKGKPHGRYQDLMNAVAGVLQDHVNEGPAFDALEAAYRTLVRY